MNSIKSFGEELKKVEINPEKVAGQYLPVIKDAKETLLVAVQKETSEELSELRSLDDILNMRERTKKLLSRLGDTSGSHSRIIHSFFAKHAKILKFQLGLLNREAGKLNRLVDRYLEKNSSLSDCLVGISKISSALSESSNLAGKIAELETDVGALKAKEKELVQKIEAFRRSEDFQRYRLDREELARIRKEAENLLSEIGAAFAKISRPVSKYTYEVGLDKESNSFIQSVMENPLNLVRNPKMEELRAILGKVSEAVKGGKIVVKNPEKDADNIAALIVNAEQYTKTYSGLASTIQLLSEKTLPVEAGLVRFEQELEKMRSQVSQKESFLDDFTRQLAQAKSTVSEELRKIEERIEKVAGSRIKVRI